VKVLHADMAASPEMLDRFIREAKAVNLIGHPNIVDISDFGVLEDGRPFFVMELLEGNTLDVLLDRQGRFSAREALDLLTPVCQALSAAHRAGVVHRDLKAANVFVIPREAGVLVKLLDFGVAKLLEPEGGPSQMTTVGRIIGTPHAMAPEQISGGAIDRRTDVYALGVLLFQLLTGRVPFDAESPLDIQRLHVEAPPPAPSEFASTAAAVDAVVLRCLQKERDDRFSSVEAFLEALRRAVDESPASDSDSKTLPAIGIYLEVRTSAEHATDPEVLENMDALLDTTEEYLDENGFVPVHETSNALLMVKVIRDRPAPTIEDRKESVGQARALFQKLRDEVGINRKVTVNLCVHVDQAATRAADFEPTGGPIMWLPAWAPHSDRNGLYATATAIEGVPEIALPPARPKHVLIDS
jgi:serine/threonine-protein kinase